MLDAVRVPYLVLTRTIRGRRTGGTPSRATGTLLALAWP